MLQMNEHEILLQEALVLVSFISHMYTIINSTSNADISKIMKNNFFNNFQNIRDIKLKFLSGIFHKGL